MEKLATFDIFDTTLLRRCGRPEAVWGQLAVELFAEDKDLVDAFMAWRRHAKGNTLASIYADIDEAYVTFSGKSREELMEVERELESTILVANPEICSIIERKRKEGWTIAFVSDMYLDSHFLHSVLEREGCIKEGERVYVSCEHHARKDTGTLYDVVRKELCPDVWHHYGDNVHSDLRMARKKGIKAFRVKTDYTDVEKTCPADLPLLAAYSRLYRIEHQHDAHASFAADYVVSAYLPYVIYVLREARRMGIRRLYFLSRDSYILLKAAQVLTAEADGLELHYLFVSRNSLLLPYLCGEDEKAYLAASDHHTLVRIDSVDKRINQLGTSRKEMLEEYGIDFPYVKVNSQEEQTDFLQKIFHSSFTPHLQHEAQQQLDLLLEYFSQEGLLDGERCAAVDIGWLGTSRLMINHILRRLGIPDMHFFYYGVRADVFPPSAGRYSTYFSTEEFTTEATVLLEHYFSASPYPSTIGYQRKVDGNIGPLFENEDIFCHNKASEANEAAIIAFASEISDYDHASLRSWAKHSIDCILSPSMVVDVAPLAQIENFDDNMPLVKRLNAVELLKILFLGDHVTGFDRGSLRLTLPHRILPYASKLQEITGRLRGYLYRRIYV